MNIKILFSSALLLIVSQLSAQNVGVGETAPASKLAVKGSMSVGASYSTTAAPANGAIIQGSVGIGTATISDNLTLNGTGGIWNSNIIKFYSDGGVTEKGFVGQYSSGSDYSIAATTSGNWMRIGSNNANIAFFPDNSITSGTNLPLVVITATGSLGVGVTTPTNKLEVAGNTKTTNFQMTNGATSGYILQSDASGNATWSNPSTASTNIYNSDGTLTGSRTVTMGGNNLTFSTTGGNMVLGSGDATGAPSGGILRGPNAGSGNTAGGTLTLNGGYAYGSGAGGSVLINGGTSGSGTNGNVYLRGGYSSGAEGAVYLNDDHGGNTFLDAAGGIVTVGKSTAGTAQLNVNNGLTIDNAAANNGSLTSSNSTTTGNGLTFGLSSGEGIASNRANNTAGANYQGLDLYSNFTKRLSVTNAGNVGIGTAAPTQTLSVNGNAGLWNNNMLNFYTDGGATQKGFVGIYSTGGSDVSLASTGSGNWLRLGANGTIAFFPDNTLIGGSTPKVVILSSGYMGIGTSAPTTMLDVRGNVNLNQNELYISGNNDNNHHIKYSSTFDGPEIAGCGGVSIVSPCYSGTPLGVFTNSGSAGSWSYSVTSAYGYLSVGEVYSYRYNKYLDVMNDLDSIDQIHPMRMTLGSGETEIVNDVATYPSMVKVKTKEGIYGTNDGNLAGLNTGAIRQLRAESKTRDRMLEDRIDRLENLVSQLTGTALGQMEFSATSVAYKDVDSYYIVDARIKPSSVISISGLSDYTIVNQSEGGFGIRFAKAPGADVRFTYSSKY